MKASIKFRDDQKPILRAKVPVSILGFPFQSGIEAGEAKELCLNFSTLFDSGPSLNLSYRPNDSRRPFGFALRTGIGRFGSPIGAPLTMSAEFSFSGNGSPRFFIQFRPRFGDFSIKGTADSQIALPAQPLFSTPEAQPQDNAGYSENNEFFENNETPTVNARSSRRLNALFFDRRIINFPAASVVVNMFPGTDLYARTKLPMRVHAVVKLRWRVRFPLDDVGDDRTATIPFQKIPHLVLSKIGIEHVAVNVEGKEGKLNEGNDMAMPCLGVVWREQDVLREENGLLRKDVEELRVKFDADKPTPAAGAGDGNKGNELENNSEESTVRAKNQNKESQPKR